MRPLTGVTAGTDGRTCLGTVTSDSGRYAYNLDTMKKKFHSQCLFNQGVPIAGLHLLFTDADELKGTFRCDDTLAGYRGMAHGGMLAAIIDASMTQCLMGHGIAGYTGELAIRYKNHVLLNSGTEIVTRMVQGRFNKYYALETIVKQESKTCVTARAKFIKISQ